MDDDQLAIIMARTDAAAGLLMAVLIEKGVVSVPEMSAILQSASESFGEGEIEGTVIASVFTGMKAMLERKRRGLRSENRSIARLQ